MISYLNILVTSCIARFISKAKKFEAVIIFNSQDVEFFLDLGNSQFMISFLCVIKFETVFQQPQGVQVLSRKAMVS